MKEHRAIELLFLGHTIQTYMDLPLAETCKVYYQIDHSCKTNVSLLMKKLEEGEWHQTECFRLPNNAYSFNALISRSRCEIAE